MAFKLWSSVIGEGGIYVILVCTINDKAYIIIGVYAPNFNQGKFLHNLFKCIAKHKQGNLIVYGDMNTVVDPILNTSSNRKPRSSPLSNILLNEDIYDACYYPRFNAIVVLISSWWISGCYNKYPLLKLQISRGLTTQLSQ